ncbi:MAG: STAS domain-containing protein [bacterium]|jgi:anti-sigma B factor antagonist
MLKKFDLTTTQDYTEDLTFQVIHINGYLDSSTFQELQDHLQGLIDQGNVHLIIDFQELNYISSAGLGVLMGMLTEVRHKGGDLKLVNMQSRIRTQFDMLGFSRMIQIYDSIDEAKAAFVKEHNSPTPSENNPEEDAY